MFSGFVDSDDRQNEIKKMIELEWRQTVSSNAPVPDPAGADALILDVQVS